jgi:Ran GTPase-activating protein (RanGAP) involved in mRNA processing and transport
MATNEIHHRGRFASFSPFGFIMKRRKRRIDQLQMPPPNDMPYGDSTEILLYHMNVGDARVLKIANSLRGNSRVQTLNLYSNNIGDDGAFAIGKVLSETGLKRLNLGGNPLIGPLGLSSIAESLKDPQCGLQALIFSRNAMGNAGCKQIASSLKTNTHLKELLLHSNIINNEGVKHLAEALKENTTLRALDLSDNSIGDEGVEALIEGLQFNTTLKHLFLGDNIISVRALKKLTRFLETDNSSLLILDAKNHQETSKSKERLINQMEHYLSLNRNGRHVFRQEPSRALIPMVLGRVADNEDHEVVYGLIRDLPHLIST